MICRISEAIRSLRAEEILRAINCFKNRVDACIAENGAHFESLKKTYIHSFPNVRGKGIHVNQAPRTWEARGLTWIKHPNGMKFSRYVVHPE